MTDDFYAVGCNRFYEFVASLCYMCLGIIFFRKLYGVKTAYFIFKHNAEIALSISALYVI